GGLVTIGGNGSAASTGGTVTITNTGSVTTLRNNATAIFAQSVGGGGGDGGTTGGVLLTIGGKGASGGNAGLVTVNHSGNIGTGGNDSNGIFAQSIGGGGGNGGLGAALTPGPASLTLSNEIALIVGLTGGGTGGTGGAVTVNQTGDITVLGAGSQAIVAESINGGGGTLGLDFSGITGLPGLPVV
ncbi:hypothetical protein G6O52_25580, partial [Salmonella enterica subsp. enterica serovar Heidelberg]|nr:hypothetical protein [Salmonella enterica subsp. enterica serovar Heidelberg]